MKALQFHPVTDKVLHIDFLQVTETKPVVVEIPVKLEGLAEGVKAGGKLALEMRKLRVKGLYTNIPERIVIDVTSLGLGKSIQVGSVSVENLEILNAKNAVVAQVKLTRAARGAAAAAASKK
jgi:large subunit ribosomal protein L25